MFRLIVQAHIPSILDRVKQDCAKYIANFLEYLDHSEKYEGSN
jgi:hypothetical protein